MILKKRISNLIFIYETKWFKEKNFRSDFIDEKEWF